jgi:hypothetical protein
MIRWNIFVLTAAAGLVAALPACSGPALPRTTPTDPIQPQGPVDKSALVTHACRRLVADLAGALEKNDVVAVLPVMDCDGGVRRLGVLVADEMQRLLLERGVKVADRRSLNAILAERDLQLATVSDPSGAQRAGQLAGADVLLVGSMIEANGEILISARAVAVESGRALAVSRSYSIDAQGNGRLMWYVRRGADAGCGGELPPLSVRCQFVTPTGSSEANLADGATVTSGQRFKIRLEPNSDCHLYVLLYDSAGQASVLFPHDDIGLPNAVRGGASYEVPEGTKWYWFDDRRGVETFYVVASYAPLSDLDRLLAQMQQAGAQSKQLAGALRERIDNEVTRGMSPATSGAYTPAEMTIRSRGVGGVVDVGWGTHSQTDEIDDIVEGHATAVKKLILNHR